MELDEEDFDQGQQAIVASASTSMSSMNTIPDGWVVDQVPRRIGDKKDKVIPFLSFKMTNFSLDLENQLITAFAVFCFVPVAQYYYEPDTGRKFRSQVSVRRHLAELKEDMKEDVPLTAALEEIKENRPLSKAFKFSNHRKVSVSTVWLEVVFKF